MTREYKAHIDYHVQVKDDFRSWALKNRDVEVIDLDALAKDSKTTLIDKYSINNVIITLGRRASFYKDARTTILISGPKKYAENFVSTTLPSITKVKLEALN